MRIEPENDPAELRHAPLGGVLARQPGASPAQPPMNVSAIAETFTLREAGNAMNAARLATKEARDALQAARADLQAARVALAQSQPAVSFQQNVRNFLAAQKLEREAKMRGEPWAIRATRSAKGAGYIDTAASYARGSEDVNSAARARNRYGYKRGAFGAERLGTPNFDPARGNVPKAVKP